MAHNEKHIPAPPDVVWSVLADPKAYGEWVVGSDSIRGADPGFPAVGTKFHHRVGVYPFTIADHTEVLESDAPHLLKLKAKARPLGTASIVLELTPRDGGTHVSMVEEGGDLVSRIVINPLTDVLVRRRNDEALRRLEQIVERRAPGRVRS